MAKAFGGYGERITEPGEDPSPRSSAASPRPANVLLEFITEKEINFSMLSPRSLPSTLSPLGRGQGEGLGRHGTNA